MADLIDRQAAIDEVKRLHDVAWANWKETRISANTMIDALKDLPSAEPERKRGHWTSDGNCSKCGEHAPFWAMASTYHTTPYCYNCGAKMERGTR